MHVCCRHSATWWARSLVVAHAAAGLDLPLRNATALAQHGSAGATSAAAAAGGGGNTPDPEAPGPAAEAPGSPLTTDILTRMVMRGTVCS